MKAARHSEKICAGDGASAGSTPDGGAVERLGRTRTGACRGPGAGTDRPGQPLAEQRAQRYRYAQLTYSMLSGKPHNLKAVLLLLAFLTVLRPTGKRVISSGMKAF